ncbi:MAG: ABC transporter substrate-binding protein [Coriobacteriales bacterium]|jgi:iron complex transport system substrate-binding protein|nr:ABC transporter substrate-binding protein [Coriobacteriales bacterium]
MKRITALLLAIALLALPLGGCGSPAPTSTPDPEPTASNPTESETPTPGPVTFTDDLGNEVSVDNPQRVIATLSSFAQTWQLAGGQNLVGLTEDAQTEGKVEIPADVQYVGTYDTLNLEQIIALEPDLVILSAAPRYKQTDLQEALKGAGINFAYFNVTHFEDYLRMLKVFTDITARPDLYDVNGEAVQERVNAILAQVPVASGEKPTVFFLITESRGTRVQNGETMPGRILTELGAENLADTNPSLLSEFSLEGLIAAEPDYIFVLPMGNSAEATAANVATLEGNPAWGDIKAVKDGKYFKVDLEHFMYKPNNLWDESYQILFDDLYK